MRKILAILAIGMSCACATVPGEKSSLERNAEEAAKDLLRIGRALAEQGAREACETVVRNGIEVLKEQSEYASLLPSAEAFCALFFKSLGVEEAPAEPKGPGVVL